MNQFIRFSLLPLLFVLLGKPAFAGEGMWLPLFLKSLNEAEMQQMGMKISAEDIYSVNKGSLKDAIVHFGGFCTSEIISPNGLMLTNHHCGYRQIQSHTSLENNYLKNGFWARNYQEELPNPGLTATLIVRIEDVSQQVLKGVKDGMSENERQSAIDKNLTSVKASIAKKAHEEVVIRPFFKGNQYFAFVTVVYRDVRLVGAPPEGIGKFGADTDNWVWPRHSGDFSLFRIYAGKDNLPAEYSEDNVPYQPKHFLPISVDGVEEGDFTLVFGFPGRTNEYLPSHAIEQLVEVVNPARISVRETALNIMDAAMKKDEKVRIQYASKQAGIANYWKKWMGENMGLKSTHALDKKRKFEEKFTEKLASHQQHKERFGHLLTEFERLYKEMAPYAHVNAYHGEVMGRNIETMRNVGLMNRLVNAYENNGEEGFKNFAGRLNGYFQNFFKNYQPSIDQDIFAALMELYMNSVDAQYVPDYVREQLRASGKSYKDMAQKVLANSILTDKDKTMALLQGPAEEAVAKIKEDPAFLFGQAMNKLHDEKVANKMVGIQDQLQQLQRSYMAALMEVFPDKRFYPDANGTMRFTYGNVKSYQPRDAVKYLPMTYLSGVMEKYIEGDYEFDVPDRLRELYASKDYGPYGEDGRMPVCFIGSNHTTGGNSGSPAIDAHGNLIGLNFDRGWEGTMSDINYDPSICRNIMVDIRYVLFIVDKFADAGHLVKEMKLVHPKKKK
ncbi:MAG: S46 family peptidase [Bacteroidota bacterium]